MVCCLNPDCEKPLNAETHKFCQSCGTKLIPLLRRRFKILHPLARGGFGKTYLAEDTDKLNEKCVVKQLVYLAQGSHANKLAVDLFMREAEQLQQLGDNLQTPSLFAYFEEGGYLFLVQQYIAGQDLLKELDDQGRFNGEKILALMQDLLPVLTVIHKRNVIHRDIKPENIMRWEKDGKLILIDFGVSKQFSQSIMSTVGTMVGSLGYAAPEQMESGIAKPNSDLYGLGVSCFHLMTGIDPWSLWCKQGYGWLDKWKVYVQQPISSKLEEVLDKLLQFETEDRYQSADDVLSDLAQAKAQSVAEKLQRYEEKFRKVVLSTYPLNNRQQKGLQQLRQSLGLADADVAQIEQLVVVQAEAEQVRKQAESKPQEQLREKIKAELQEQQSQEEKSRGLGNKALTPVAPQKNRRKILTFIALGGVGFCSVLIREAMRNGSTSKHPSQDKDGESLPLVPAIRTVPLRNLKSFEFETVSVDIQGNITTRKQEQAQFFSRDLGYGAILEMVLIPGGTFTMGSPSSELLRNENEGPLHEVTVPAFYLSKYEVTQAQWSALMDDRFFENQEEANHPVIGVSWLAAVEFCQKLSEITRKDYRLPSEAEWEFACRAGTNTPFYFGETVTPKLANYMGLSTYGSGPSGEYRKQTTEVGSFSPNAYGLYDMHGNVWEWCQDTWHANYKGAPTNGNAWQDNDDSQRILRGGSWNNSPRSFRSAARNKFNPKNDRSVFGLRLALVAPNTLPDIPQVRYPVK